MSSRVVHAKLVLFLFAGNSHYLFALLSTAAPKNRRKIACVWRVTWPDESTESRVWPAHSGSDGTGQRARKRGATVHSLCNDLTDSALTRLYLCPAAQLCLAADQGDLRQVKLLVARGARGDVNARDLVSCQCLCKPHVFLSVADGFPLLCEAAEQNAVAGSGFRRPRRCGGVPAEARRGRQCTGQCGFVTCGCESA